MNYVKLKILITGMNQKERIQYLSSLADEAIETTESGVIEFSLDFKGLMGMSGRPSRGELKINETITQIEVTDCDEYLIKRATHI